MLRISIFVFLFSCVVSLPVYASDNDGDYYLLVQNKLQRGAHNVALGWAEIPQGIQTIGNRHGVGAAATWGLLHGVGRAIQRTAVGIFEVLTFPVGLPQDFAPIIEPEYVIGSE